MGHVVSSTQKLTYAWSELPMRVTEQFPLAFGKGSSPKEWASNPDIMEVKYLLVYTIDKLIEDYNSGLFQHYKEYPTSYGFVIKNIDAAIMFCNVHESLHLGNIMSMKKLV